MTALAILLHLLLGFGAHPALPTHDVLQPNGIVAQCDTENTCLIPPLVVGPQTLPGEEVLP